MSAKPSDTSSPLAEISHGPSKLDQFLEKNQVLLLALAILVALGTAAYVIVSGIQQSKQETAGASLIDVMSVDDLDKVIEEHEGTQAAKSAHLQLAAMEWYGDEKEASIEPLNKFIKDHPDHLAIPSAKASLASKLLAQGEASQAESLFRELADDPKSRYISAYALISLGDMAAADGKEDIAKSSYDRVLAEFADSSFASVAGQRISELGVVPPTEVPAPAPEPDKPEDNIPPSILRPEGAQTPDKPEEPKPEDKPAPKPEDKPAPKPEDKPAPQPEEKPSNEQ